MKITKHDMAFVVCQALFNMKKSIPFDKLPNNIKRQHGRYMKMKKDELSRWHERALKILQS